MALASYANLTAAVADWLHRSDLTSPIADFVVVAENRINREVRCADMETAYTGTISAGVIAVPTDFLEWKAVYIDSNGANRLQPKSWEWVLQNYPTRSSDGLPKFIARNASNFEFGPYPDSAYSVKGTYYKRLAAVSSSWHNLATEYPDLYLFGTLVASAPYLGDDPRIATWNAAYETLRDSINQEAVKADISGAPLVMTRG